jgi:hypothetical protein
MLLKVTSKLKFLIPQLQPFKMADVRTSELGAKLEPPTWGRAVLYTDRS